MIEALLWMLVIAIAFSAAYAGLSAAPWLPTKPRQRRHLIDRVVLEDNDVCYDLGSGDGSVLFALTRKNPNIHAIGYEISLLPYLVSLARKILGGKIYRGVSLRFGNLFKQNLRDADVIFVFLLDKSYPKLLKKFRSELKNEARIYVEAWPFPGVVETEKITEQGLLPVYVYKGSDFRDV